MRKRVNSRNKALVLSLLAIALSVAIIAGAAYALFSQKKEYDIEIESGNISVAGTFDIVSAWSQAEDAADDAREMGTEQADGSIKVPQGGVFGTGIGDGTNNVQVTISDISQGDGAEYTLSLTNASTVKMKYRVYVRAEETNALTDALVFTADGVRGSITDETVTVVGWTTVEAGAALTDEIRFGVTLPWGSNEAAGQTAKLYIVVDAVQANASEAHTWSELPEYFAEDGKVYKKYVCTECGERSEPELVENGVVLTPDAYVGKIKTGDAGDNMVYVYTKGEYDNLQVYLHGAENVTLFAEDGVVVNGKASIGYHSGQDGSNPVKADSTLRVSGFTVKGELFITVADQRAYITDNSASQITVKTFVLDGMEIVLEGNTADGSLGSSGQSYGMFIVPNKTDYTLTVRNNIFRNLGSHGITVQGGGDGSAVTAAALIVVENNVFESFGLTKTERAAFKIWADTKFAPTALSWETNTTADLTEEAKELVAQIAAGNNVLNPAGEGENQRYWFDFYGLYFDEL